MKEVQSTTVRERWRDVLDDVMTGERIIVTRKGKAIAIIISVDDYERFNRTYPETQSE